MINHLCLWMKLKQPEGTTSLPQVIDNLNHTKLTWWHPISSMYRLFSINQIDWCSSLTDKGNCMLLRDWWHIYKQMRYFSLNKYLCYTSMIEVVIFCSRELMPKLPTDGIFSIDQMLRKGSFTQTDAVMWQWRDDRSIWHHYTAIDSKIVEVCLCVLMALRCFWRKQIWKLSITNTQISLNINSHVCNFWKTIFVY